MTERDVVLVQLAIALTGFVITIYTFVEAVISYRVLRVLKLNDVHATLTTGDVIDESLRLSKHAVIIMSTLLFVMLEPTETTWHTRAALVAVTMLTSVSSLNRLVVRRRVLRSDADA